MARRVIQISTIKQLLKLLHRGEYSKAQIADKLGVRINTVCDWLCILHTKPENLVYIAAWRRAVKSGPYTAYWSFGYCMEDAIKPAPLSREVRRINQRVRGNTTLTEKGLIHAAD